MLHPSYSDLMKVVNSEVEEGHEKVVNSRYSIVIATAKRARQIVAGSDASTPLKARKKPLSMAVEELYDGKIRILPEEEEAETAEAVEAETEETADAADTAEAE